jgi:hypothetical protein
MNQQLQIGPVPKGVIDAVQAVVNYLWDDERSDFLCRPEEEPGGHIYESLVELAEWLNDKAY